MPVVRYTCGAGRIIAEKRGGSRKFYAQDPIGSTCGLFDMTHTQTDAFEYWPFGGVRTRTGTTPTPFTYVGTLGYYSDNGTRSYVRARHYRSDLGRWISQSPIWPKE